MRMSCNGCRVLRKGCSQNCSIKPCLQWIKTPDSQANATLFLAKFYGRAGLLNLLNAGPDHLRPEVFRSLLYEACGRIVNPLHGSTGLLWSGNWQLCQNAVDAVLKGAPITSVASEAAATLPLKACDIGHVKYKYENCGKSSDLHRIRDRCRFKRSGAKSKVSTVCAGSGDEEVNRSTSHESSLCHQSLGAAPNVERESREIESLNSVEIAQSESEIRHASDVEIELELTLGFAPKVK